MLIFRNLTAAQAQNIDWRAQEITPLLPDPAHAASCIASGGTVIVILREDKVIGLVSLEAATTNSSPVCGILSELVILPAFRRQHLGRMLMGLAANATADRSVWFLAGNVPQTPEAAAFAASVGMKPVSFLQDMQVLDLSDVSGLRNG